MSRVRGCAIGQGGFFEDLFSARMYFPKFSEFSGFFDLKVRKISEKHNFSSKNRSDENRYTLGYVFFDAESDFHVTLAPSLTVFRKKSVKKCYFH